MEGPMGLVGHAKKNRGITLEGAEKKHRDEPYRSCRWVRCTWCMQMYRVRVSRLKRLRMLKSPCCEQRMRPLAWFRVGR